jgi:hypothetical protein
MKRQLRTRLDIMRPDVGKTVEQAQERQQAAYRSSQQTKEFKDGDLVWARNYREGDKWVPASVVKRKGPLTYRVRINDSLVWKRHVDQLKPRTAEQSPFIDFEFARQPAEENGNPEPVQEAGEPQRRYPLRNRRPQERYGFEAGREEM